MNEYVKIFDTTLRDGEQSPGASMNVEEKVIIAKQLSRLGVDVIEAGFAISSPGDFEAVRRISREVEGPIVCSLARAKLDDIDRAWEALKGAPKPRIHTFISTSDIHLKHQFRMTREEAKKRAVEMVKRARGYVDDVEFSPMDASRSDAQYLYEVLEAVIAAGASTVNIPDTVGYAIPSEFGELIKGIKDNVPNINKAVISVHCHNDLGLAVANSLAAVMNGARQVECTINGIGERAGNASLEEIVMILRTRRDILNIDTKITTEHIHPTSRLISSITGIMVQPNKAIVGDNAFAHESGIHQDGLLKEKTTYEIMRPESIGLSQSTLVMGKHSGRHAFKTRLKELGYELSEENLNKAFERFKVLADQKKEIFDEDIEAIVAEEILRIELPERFRLEKLHVASGTETVPTAMVEMFIDGRHEKETGTGDGPVDAVYKTIAKMTKTKSRLLKFSVNAITGGTDAQGEVTVRLQEDDHIVLGQGAHTDIIVASAKAYINALNKLEYKKREKKERVV
ncbi:MAG: 2-isopropylmalate synthase [Deltaproteobacteria bacterium RIFCSPLOWO2_12_FULL_43_16]|nr:MAG: 2-isopropylmalate synthase [Deltaproteobacteria bacterium GWA2_43_19]OGQ09185.1 MAG: 2-isopropylmalate synthase [Deltaproteobacteria bacterium RIFCSPHIGHO2_02_FULL_43_33]OGQ61705.1 MAG: 2-isopropylmalate synthase [Deltaproteobacteria bacterium RIFCSPLOWO2_12_FULL_43_16]HBR17640.1 2-isopropylmalate synthase [Deltaproteobacteria bacterium]